MQGSGLQREARILSTMNSPFSMTLDWYEADFLFIPMLPEWLAGDGSLFLPSRFSLGDRPWAP